MRSPLTSRVTERLIRNPANLANRISGYRPFYTGIATAFGIDRPTNEERFSFLHEQVFPLLIRPENKYALDILTDKLPLFSHMSASSACRVYPLGLVVDNTLSGKGMFSTELIASLPQDVQDHLTKEHPCYGNAYGLPEELCANDMQNIVIPIRIKSTYRWLDIGTAPKTGGSPTLNALKSMLPDNFEFDGVDLAFPIFEIIDGEIARSEYVDDTFNFREWASINGVNYLNANIPDYDIRSRSVFSGKTYDFVSVCMTMYQLASSSPFEISLFSSRNISGQNGAQFTLQTRICREQVESIDNMLNLLNIGGVLFLDPCFTLHEDSVSHYYMTEMFFAIQRTGRDTYTLYDNCPIPFVSQRRGVRYVKVLSVLTTALFRNYPGLRKEAKRILTLCDAADMIHYRNQRWNKCIYFYEEDLAARIANRSIGLEELFRCYLSCVPNYGGSDSELKRRIIQEVSSIEHRTSEPFFASLIARFFGK